MGRQLWAAPPVVARIAFAAATLRARSQTGAPTRVAPSRPPNLDRALFRTKPGTMLKLRWGIDRGQERARLLGRWRPSIDDGWIDLDNAIIHRRARQAARAAKASATCAYRQAPDAASAQIVRIRVGLPMSSSWPAG